MESVYITADGCPECDKVLCHDNFDKVINATKNPTRATSYLAYIEGIKKQLPVLIIFNEGDVDKVYYGSSEVNSYLNNLRANNATLHITS